MHIKTVFYIIIATIVFRFVSISNPASAQSTIQFRYNVVFDSSFWATYNTYTYYLLLRSRDGGWYDCIANDNYLQVGANYGVLDTSARQHIGKDDNSHQIATIKTFDSLWMEHALVPESYLYDKMQNRSFHTRYFGFQDCFITQFEAFKKTNLHKQIGAWDCVEYVATDTANFPGLHIWVSKQVNKLCNFGFAFDTFEGGVVQWRIDGKVTCTLSPDMDFVDGFKPKMVSCETTGPDNFLSSLYYYWNCWN